MNIQEYIDSGILESYIMGAASEAEVKELLYFKKQYPQIQNALFELETEMERIARQMAIIPPPGTWEKIEASINEIVIPEYEPSKFRKDAGGNNKDTEAEQYINIEAEMSHMRVHKNWKWVFIAVFVLSKIFLACAIYFYLENRQAQEQIQELKTELRQSHSVK